MTKVQDKVQTVLDKYDIVYRVLDCDPELADTAAFCEHYGFSPSQAANTILVVSKKVDPEKYSVCVVLATHKLDVNKAVCKAMGIKRASFANAQQTINQTSMMIGGVTAIGIDNLPIFVDSSVMAQKEVIMGGGNRSSKIILNPQELAKLPGVEIIENVALPK